MNGEFCYSKSAIAATMADQTNNLTVCGTYTSSTCSAECNMETREAFDDLAGCCTIPIYEWFLNSDDYVGDDPTPHNILACLKENYDCSGAAMGISGIGLVGVLTMAIMTVGSFLL